jgi:catechol 2,3-dioxygenase-like lactoylglutathione lyase family enzyme
MNESEPFRCSFEHVALALHRMTDAWPVFADALGGRYHDRGLAGRFSWLQLRYANGFVLETLHPEDLPDTGGSQDRRGDFVHRFLARRGPGPHHLTFRVSDLDRAVERLATAGLVLGQTDRRDRRWQEALYGAHGAHGMVLHVVQRDGELPQEPDPPEGFPDLGYDHPVASLSRVVLAVVDLEGALAAYRDALGGRVVSSGAAVDGNHWVELGWESPGRLRLLEATRGGIAEWVGDRPGRLRHLYFTFDAPATVPGARRVAEGRWAVEPDEHLGVRLVIASTARSEPT